MAEPYYTDGTVQLFHGDCLNVLRGMPDASVDSICTDPPYGLEFMGKGWDAPWQVGSGINADAGFNGGGISATRNAPSFTGSTNPKCLTCKGTRRGRRDGTALVKVCTCSDPRFPNVRAIEMRAFGEWCQTWTVECLRVLKPGGYMLAFGGTRTHHRLACAVEDAGFEIRDTITWLYGSGFAKSLDVSKAIDKRRDWSLVERLSGEIKRARGEAGLSLTEIGQAMLAATDGAYGKWYHRGGHMFFETGRSLPTRPEWAQLRLVLPIVDEFAQVYDAAEREVIGSDTKARSEAGASALPTLGAATKYETWDLTAPATDAAKRWQGWGTALKPASEPIVVARKPLTGTVAANVLAHGTGALNIDACRVDVESTTAIGRWPPYNCVEGCPVSELDRQTGTLTSGGGVKVPPGSLHGFIEDRESTRNDSGRTFVSNSGGASRFFPTFRYEAKAPAHERPKGDDGTGHPTVKPLGLMRWLVRLVTPPGGLCLDPFAGSGTTGEACVIEGFRCILIEQDSESLPRIVNRLSKPIQPDIFGGVA